MKEILQPAYQSSKFRTSLNAKFGYKTNDDFIFDRREPSYDHREDEKENVDRVNYLDAEFERFENKDGQLRKWSEPVRRHKRHSTNEYQTYDNHRSVATPSHSSMKRIEQPPHFTASKSSIEKDFKYCIEQVKALELKKQMSEESKLSIIKKVISKFRHDHQFQENQDYIRLWITFLAKTDNQRTQLKILSEMEECNIGQKSSLYFIAKARIIEMTGSVIDTEKIFNRGLEQITDATHRRELLEEMLSYYYDEDRLMETLSSTNQNDNTNQSKGEQVMYLKKTLPSNVSFEEYRAMNFKYAIHSKTKKPVVSKLELENYFENDSSDEMDLVEEDQQLEQTNYMEDDQPSEETYPMPRKLSFRTPFKRPSIRQSNRFTNTPVGLSRLSRLSTQLGVMYTPQHVQNPNRLSMVDQSPAPTRPSIPQYLDHTQLDSEQQNYAEYIVHLKEKKKREKSVQELRLSVPPPNKFDEKEHRHSWNDKDMEILNSRALLPLDNIDQLLPNTLKSNTPRKKELKLSTPPNKIQSFMKMEDDDLSPPTRAVSLPRTEKNQGRSSLSVGYDTTTTITQPEENEIVPSAMRASLPVTFKNRRSLQAIRRHSYNLTEESHTSKESFSIMLCKIVNQYVQNLEKEAVDPYDHKFMELLKEAMKEHFVNNGKYKSLNQTCPNKYELRERVKQSIVIPFPSSMGLSQYMVQQECMNIASETIRFLLENDRGDQQSIVYGYTSMNGLLNQLYISERIQDKYRHHRSEQQFECIKCVYEDSNHMKILHANNQEVLSLKQYVDVYYNKRHSCLKELVAMFFTISLIQSVHDLHRIGIIHGALSPDCILIRGIQRGPKGSQTKPNLLDDPYIRSQGVLLTNFSKSLDLNLFTAGVQFDLSLQGEVVHSVHQLDYLQLFYVIHYLLHHHEISNPMDAAPIKPYHQAALWEPLFDALLENNGRLPLLRLIEPLKEYLQQKWHDNPNLLGVLLHNGHQVVT